MIARYGTSFEFFLAITLGINPSFAKAAPLLGVPIDAAILIPPIDTKVPAPTKNLPALPIIFFYSSWTGALETAKSGPNIPIAIPIIAI